jgi:hypothetical protein
MKLQFNQSLFTRVKAILAFTLILGAYIYMTPRIFAVMGADWIGAYVPAARALLAGINPYHFVPSFFNPVWILIPLIPLAVLPPFISMIIMAAIIMDIYIFIGLKLKAKPLAFAAFLLSPPVIFSFRQLNIDAFVLLGFILPAPIGLFFAILKPQIGIGMVIYWLIEAYRLGGIRRVAITFAPVTIALAVTFAMYGNWFAGSNLIHAAWNWSIFPFGIPIGLALLAGSFYWKKKYLAASAGPFLAPYVALYSWYIALIGFFDNEILMILTVIIMWAVIYFH